MGPYIKKYSKTATPYWGYCLFAGRVSHFPERYYYITALVGAVARLRVYLYTSLCWHCVLFVLYITDLIIGGELRPSVLTRVSLLATPECILSIFYQLVPIRICLPSSPTLPDIGSYTHRSLTPTTFFIFRITDIELVSLSD